jgi:predicted membrane protein
MHYRRLVSRFSGSWWTWIVVLPFAFLELLATVAAAYTGEWNLPALLALIIVLFVIRAVLILFLFFTPVPVGIIAAWACYWLFKKRSRKETRQGQNDQRTSQNT